jgi:TM2 domain-containing membrane protein YozV
VFNGRNQRGGGTVVVTVLLPHHTPEIAVSGQGSAGNVVAALCSFFVPGLGQLLQGRLMMAILQFVLATVLWFVLLGWAIHLWSVLDAALWKPKI